MPLPVPGALLRIGAAFLIYSLVGVCSSGLLQPACAQQLPPSPEAAAHGLPSSPVPSVPAPQQAVGKRIELIPADTLFYVENRGATRIFVNVNGAAFKLAADSAEVARSANAFPLPRSGEITINIAAFLEPAGSNYVELSVQGPPGTDARFIVANVLLAGQEVAYRIDEGSLEALPGAPDLLGSYPNPFREQTKITYHIPADRMGGVGVRLSIYDVRGRKVTTLARGRHFPGRFTAVWNGRSDQGQPVASGVYFARLIAGSWDQTVKMVRIR